MSSRRIAVLVAATSLLLLVPLLLLPREAHGQAQPVPGERRSDGLDAKLRVPDSTHAQLMKLRDGSTLLGRIVAAEGDTVRFRTSFATIPISRTMIADVRLVRQPSVGPGGELWPADPNATRLFFGPTGRTLERGDGYFADTYLLFLSYFQGLGDRVTLGAGMSIIPTDDFLGDNVMFAMPKIGVVRSPTFNVAVGGLVAITPNLDDEFQDETSTVGIGYAVATAGSPDASVTAGLGYGFVGNDMADSPLLMFGATKRLSRRTALVTENYIVPDADGALISYGLRFFGERMAVDLAFWNIAGGDDSIPLPGVPYVAFTIHR